MTAPPGAASAGSPRRGPLGAAEADLAVVTRLVRASGTSFYRGMRILPPDRRVAMYAVYAFCRLVDDIADDSAPMEEKRAGLDCWRARVEALCGGHAPDGLQPGSPKPGPLQEGPLKGGPLQQGPLEEDPMNGGGASDDAAVARVLQRATERFGLRRIDFLAIIDGMQMDAETEIVAPPAEMLDLYCDRVASAVGRLSVRAFGDASPAADEVAHHLGRALQLTNILRDLSEDAWRGRLYLAREWLAMAGVPPEPAAALASAHLPAACERALRQARGHFTAAQAAMARCDRRAMRPARLMSATYKAVLDRLEKRGWQRLDQRVSVPAWEKLLIAARFSAHLA